MSHLPGAGRSVSRGGPLVCATPLPCSLWQYSSHTALSTALHNNSGILQKMSSNSISYVWLWKYGTAFTRQRGSEVGHQGDNIKWRNCFCFEELHDLCRKLDGFCWSPWTKNLYLKKETNIFSVSESNVTLFNLDFLPMTGSRLGCPRKWFFYLIALHRLMMPHLFCDGVRWQDPEEEPPLDPLVHASPPPPPPLN